jgi:hypothetical protein
VVRGKDGGFRTVHVQRGTLTVVSGTSVTVRSGDGFSETWTLDAGTVIRKNRQKVSASALKVGDEIRIVVGPESGGKVTAERLVVRPPGGKDGNGGKGGRQRGPATPGSGTPR